MTASQMRIAETIDAFYGDAGTKDGVSRSYKQAVDELDAETIKALDGPYRTTVLEPISRFCAYFPDINECIKKRNHKLLDYDQMRAKVKKLVEKPDKDPGKLPRTEKEAQMAKDVYESLNEQLTTELPQLIDFRVPYLDPSFEALVKIQLRCKLSPLPVSGSVCSGLTVDCAKSVRRHTRGWRRCSSTWTRRLGSNTRRAISTRG